jgi:hypothetical protein
LIARLNARSRNKNPNKAKTHLPAQVGAFVGLEDFDALMVPSFANWMGVITVLKEKGYHENGLAQNENEGKEVVVFFVLSYNYTYT